MSAMEIGDHRYIDGVPITLVHHDGRTLRWVYVQGWVDLHEVDLEKMMPMRPEHI